MIGSLTALVAANIHSTDCFRGGNLSVSLHVGNYRQQEAIARELR